MGPSPSTIEVSAKVKSLLERAKGDKDWDTFLQELLGEWKDIREASPDAPDPKTEELAPLPLTGFVMNVMKPWSMKITNEGVQLEEIPHADTETGREKTSKEEAPANCPLPHSVYEGWSNEGKEAAPPPKEPASVAPPKVRRPRAGRTVKKKRKTTPRKT
jgi:hypothetical protein